MMMLLDMIMLLGMMMLLEGTMLLDMMMLLHMMLRAAAFGALRVVAHHDSGACSSTKPKQK